MHRILCISLLVLYSLALPQPSQAEPPEPARGFLHLSTPLGLVKAGVVAGLPLGFSAGYAWGGKLQTELRAHVLVPWAASTHLVVGWRFLGSDGRDAGGKGWHRHHPVLVNLGRYDNGSGCQGDYCEEDGVLGLSLETGIELTKDNRYNLRFLIGAGKAVHNYNPESDSLGSVYSLVTDVGIAF